MQSVTVKRKKLIEILEDNMKNHRALFEKAQEGYRQKLVEVLEERLEAARKGRHIEQYLNLPEPEDMTREYKRVLRMLDLSIDDDITLSAADFAMYVQDDWSWKRAFLTTTSNYVSVN